MANQEEAGALLAQVDPIIKDEEPTVKGEEMSGQSGFGIHPGGQGGFGVHPGPVEDGKMAYNTSGDNVYVPFNQFSPSKNGNTPQKRKPPVQERKYALDSENGHCTPPPLQKVKMNNGSAMTSEPDSVKDERPSELKLESSEKKGKHCLHYTATPEGYVQPKFTPRDKPARTWPFQLDDFQRLATQCLDKNESVLVAAHTSAGKTVVAEYAVALAFEKTSRCIYTAPIKALSNQKYRELKEEFDDVGLMTGDVNIAPHASCIVMTTEILRNMLLRGHEMLREVTWVIFDEVHYMRDNDRGIVWEESIILIPKTIKCVYLSATLANHEEFADWVCHLKQEPCHCITTNFRPTPLCHYAFPPGGSGIFLLKDEAGNFKKENFVQASQCAKAPQTDGQGGPSDLARLLVMAKERDWLPIIVFSFARRECEGNAMSVSTIDLTDDSEKELVEEVFMSAIEGLLEEDRELPQIKTLLPLLKRGIGVHHSGLLPILKEVVEILFQESLVKVLFATETFAMGVNMPAKSVVFMSMQKYDGKGFRYLSSGEYIQMSGRAGRRNTDKRGICILMLDDELDEKTTREMMLDQPDPIDSKFRLSYNMILNLMRVESDNDPEYVIKMSLLQFQYERNLPKVGVKLEALDLKMNTVEMTDKSDVYNYMHMNDLVENLRSQLQDIAMRPSVLLPYMQPGRVVKIKNRKGDEKEDFGWGIVVNFIRKYSPDGYEIHVLLPISGMKVFGLLSMPLPVSKETLAKLESNYKAHDVCQNPKKPTVKFEIVRVMSDMIDIISTVRLYMPRNLSDPRIRQRIFEVALRAKQNFPNGFPAVSAMDMGLNNSENLESQSEADTCMKISNRITSLKTRIEVSPINKLPIHQKREYCSIYQRKKALQIKIDGLKKQEEQSHLIMYRTELKNRIRVLRRLGHITPDGVMQEKGKIAAEVEGVDELVMTELIFEGLFLELDVSTVMALITCFFQMPKLKEETQLSPKLGRAFKRLKSAAMLVCGVQIDCKIELDEAEYLDTFKPNLMMLTEAWISGKSFPDICKLSDEFEGSIIRNLRRLEELLRQLVEAAKAIGNKELEDKFEEGSRLLKRGIVFANSLYV